MMIVCIRFTNGTVAAKDARENLSVGMATRHTATDKEVKGDHDAFCITKNGCTVWRQVESQKLHVHRRVTPPIHKCGLHNPFYSTLLFPFFYPFFSCKLIVHHGYCGIDSFRNSIRALSKTSSMHLAWLWKAFQYVLLAFDRDIKIIQLFT